MGNPFVHAELNTTDVDKAKKFYSSVFDWKLEEMPMPEIGNYTIVSVGEGTGGGIMVHFLGAGRKASIVVTQRIAAANVVVLEQTVSLETKGADGRWTPRTRRQVTLLEFEGTKIRRLADYWAR